MQPHLSNRNDPIDATGATNMDTCKPDAKQQCPSAGGVQNPMRQGNAQERVQTNVQHVQERIKSQVLPVLYTWKRRSRRNSRDKCKPPYANKATPDPRVECREEASSTTQSTQLWGNQQLRYAITSRTIPLLSGQSNNPKSNSTSLLGSSYSHSIQQNSIPKGQLQEHDLY